MLGAPVERSIVTYTATTIAAVDGGAGLDSFTDSATQFIVKGFSVDDSVLAIGFTGGMQYIVGPFKLLSVAAGIMEVATGLLTADAAGESVTLVALKGGSFRDIFKDGRLCIYSGVQPATADAAITGTLLLQLTISSGAFVPGAVSNGLEFAAPSGGIIGKSADVWSGVVLATGVAGYYRLYANAADTGVIDTTFIYPRVDGLVATSGGELNMSNTTLTVAKTVTIDSVNYTFPGVK